VLRPPAPTSNSEYAARLGDVAFWQPYLDEILGRHGLRGGGRAPVAGANPTHPTFVCGDVVVKVFGWGPSWRAGHAAELAAHSVLAADPGIAAPRLVAEGRLVDDPDVPWPYLVTARVEGTAWRDAALTPRERRTVVAELGEQVRRLHALDPAGAAASADWPEADLVEAARRSSLPTRLIAQVDAFVRRLGPPDTVFVHGDLVAAHVFVAGGRLAGIIDWGDAMAADRHYELMQIHRDLFDCDRGLLREFVEAAAWPVGPRLPELALAHGLRRQAIGLAQHGSMDVFRPVAARLPLHDIGTLEELATALFAV
jgi:hypothetical protein